MAQVITRVHDHRLYLDVVRSGVVTESFETPIGALLEIENEGITDINEMRTTAARYRSAYSEARRRGWPKPQDAPSEDVSE